MANLSSPGEMAILAERYYGSDNHRKANVYCTEYESLFGSMRQAPIRLLELGVRFGASMLLWSDYFPNATIVGLDIEERPKNFPADGRVHFVRGSQDDPAALDRCVTVAGGQFDIIVDDASHVGRLSASSFSYLFPRRSGSDSHRVRGRRQTSRARIRVRRAIEALLNAAAEPIAPFKAIPSEHL